jgi:hypothetical protein
MTHCGGYDATPESLLAAGISCAGAAYRDWIASIVAARNIETIRVKLADNGQSGFGAGDDDPGRGPCG